MSKVYRCDLCKDYMGKWYPNSSLSLPDPAHVFRAALKITRMGQDINAGDDSFHLCWGCMIEVIQETVLQYMDECRGRLAARD